MRKDGSCPFCAPKTAKKAKASKEKPPKKTRSKPEAKAKKVACKKVKVETAIGPTLDWLVAHASGFAHSQILFRKGERAVDRFCFVDGKGDRCDRSDAMHLFDFYNGGYYAPSTNPSHGNPLLEEFGIGTYVFDSENRNKKWLGCSSDVPRTLAQFGPTLLIAGLRHYVVFRCGPEVDVPNYL